MKIGNPVAGIQEQAPVAPAAAVKGGPEHAAKAAPGVAADSSATVELSSTAASLLSGTKGAPAEFDADKVASIAQAIADGTMKINPEAIADKLIANARELLGKAQS
jgi:negative regulator of flagellin synthesis FlgM